MLKTLLTNNKAMTASAIALLGVGVAMSITHRDFLWLNRFGALVVCSGVLIMARPVILREDIKINVIMETGFSHFDDAHYKATNEPIPDWVIQDRRSRTAVGWLGPLFVFIGTAATGFGDLLNTLVGYAAV